MSNRYIPEKNSHRVFLGLGSNLGDRKGFIDQGIEKLSTVAELTYIQSSNYYETDPLGPSGEIVSQPQFLNAVCEFETNLSPEDLLTTCLKIEKSLGRNRTITNKKEWKPRTIDIDLLFYEQEIIHHTELTIPHPELHKRLFVLEPMAEISPDWNHPQLNQTIEELLKGIRLTKRKKHCLTIGL